MARTLPPVQSPLSLRGICSGWASAHSKGLAAGAEADFRAALASRGFTNDVRFLDSGTSALAVAIRASASARHTVVALPAYGCFDLATAVDAAGVPFVLYDLDPSTLRPASRALERAHASGAGICIVVHLYGVPVDLQSQREQLPADVIFLDDAAQGIGGMVHGRPLGAAGDLGILSFGRGKGLTGGGGGALLVNRKPETADIPDGLAPAPDGAVRAFLTAQAQWLLARPGLYALPRALPFLNLGETHYRAPAPATAMSAFALGVLAAEVQFVDAELAARRATAQRYREALRDLEGVGLPPDDAGAGWLRFPVMVTEAAEVAARANESARLGIMPGYPMALSELEGFGERRQNSSDDFPGARLLAKRLFTLPTHGRLAPRDVDAVIARVRKFGG